MRVYITNNISKVKYYYRKTEKGKWVFIPEVDIVYMMYPDGNGEYLYRWFKLLAIRIDPKKFNELFVKSNLWHVPKKSMQNKRLR